MNLTLRNHHETLPIKGHKQLNVELLNGSDALFSMQYDVGLHTARMKGKGARRLFMVYTEGKRMPKHVFKNEYGFDVGLIDPQAAYNNYGCIQLYDKTYYYNLDFIPAGSLSIFHLPETNALLTLKLDSFASGINNLPDDYYNLLLGGLAWYLGLPVKAEVVNANTYSNQPKAIRV